MACFGFNLADIITHLCGYRFRALGFESRLVELDNGSVIHCWVPDTKRHANKPKLMLIHGFGGDGTLAWWNQIPALVNEFALYIPDLLFFGESYTTNDQRSEIFQAQCFLQFLKLEGVKEISALGTSYGGFVAFYMAHLAPDMVKKVVFASSGICMDQTSQKQLLLDSKCSDVLDLLIPKDIANVKCAINFSLYKPLAYIPHFLLIQLQQRFNINRKQRIQLIRGKCIGSKSNSPLPILGQKALIIWGYGDRIFPIEQAYKLQKHLGPKSELVIIPKTGHMPQIENSKEFNASLLAFLKRELLSKNIDQRSIQ